SYPTGVTPRSGRPFAFAGLWDLWVGEKQKLLTCCLVTTTPNELVQPVHDRMPCIVPPPSYGEWLDPRTPVERGAAPLRAYPAEERQVGGVAPAVISQRNDGPESLEPA